jgi:hypothetical protein
MSLTVDIGTALGAYMGRMRMHADRGCEEDGLGRYLFARGL